MPRDSKGQIACSGLCAGDYIDNADGVRNFQPRTQRQLQAYCAQPFGHRQTRRIGLRLRVESSRPVDAWMEIPPSDDILCLKQS